MQAQFPQLEPVELVEAPRVIRTAKVIMVTEILVAAAVVQEMLKVVQVLLVLFLLKNQMHI